MLKQMIEKIKNSKIMKNVTKISSGTLFGQIISIITVPIFTRIYGAEILGIWAFLNAIYLFVNSFSDLGLTFSIMTEKGEEKRKKTYTIITTIVAMISIIIAIGIGIVYSTIKTNDTGLNIIFLVIYSFIAIFTLQQTQVCYTWLNKKEKYSVLMKNPIINNVTFAIFGIGIGLLGFKEYGYFIGWLLGQIVTLIHMKRYLPKKMFNFNFKEYKDVLKEHTQFLKYQLPANIVNVFKNQLPTYLIESFFGTTILGYYSIAVKVLNIPIVLLGNAVGRVFFQESSNMTEKGKKIGEFTYKSLITMMKVGILPMIGLVAFGKIIIIIFLGKDWEVAGDIISIVAFQSYFMFLTASVQGISINLNKQNYVRNMYIAQAITIFLSFVVGRYIFNNIYIALLLMVITFIIINVTYFCAMFKVMEVSYKDYLKKVILNFGIIFIISVLIKIILEYLASLIGLIN